MRKCCAISPKHKCDETCSIAHFCKLSKLTPSQKKRALIRARNRKLP